MGDGTGIQWTDATWNPIVGCSIVSPGCTNCYAMKEAARQIRCAAGAGRSTHYDGTVEMVKDKTVWTGVLKAAPDHILTTPLRWTKSRRIFVNSMSDLFHENVPDERIDRIFAIMALSPQHRFQILTKRAERMKAHIADPAMPRRVYEIACDMTIDMSLNVTLIADPAQARFAPDGRRVFLGVWPLPNVWLGVSAERQKEADERIPLLLDTPAAIRFVSCEPLLGPIDIENGAGWLWHYGEGNLREPVKGWPNHPRRSGGLDWIIVGGESGPDARPMHPDWVRSLRDQCTTAGVPFFFKQHGAWIEGSGLGASEACIVYSDGRHGPFTEQYARTQDCDGLHNGYAPTAMHLVSKKKAGRLLDGREWNEMPGGAP